MNDELNGLDAEFRELEEEFGLEMAGEFDVQVDQQLQRLDEEAAALGLGPEPMTLESLTSGGMEGQAEMAFVGNFIKNKVAKLIKKLLALIKKYAVKCKHCVAAVTKAVVLFKAGKYVAALKAAYDAYRCVRACAK